VALAGILVCGGCQGWPGPDSLYVYVETDSSISPVVELGSTRERAHKLIEEFRKVNPGVNIHIRDIPSDHFVGSTADRTSRGLGPDLMVTRVVTALRLNQQGLSQAVQLNSDQLAKLEPRFLQDFRVGRKLLAVPLSAQPEVACYDRRRVPTPPRDLDELISLSAKGLRVGLPLVLTDLYWTSSGVKAVGAVRRLLQVPTTAAGALMISPADRKDLLRWITWLNNANLQQNVEFSEDQANLVQRLEQGQIDWITCSSLSLLQLSKTLGPSLGVSELPGRPGQPAQGLTRLRVWSFGQHSSPRQRQLAEEFVLFTLNRVIQKRLMLEAPGNLPVNPSVLIPTKRSDMMAALAGSLEKAQLLNFRDPDRIETRLTWIDDVLERAIVTAAEPAEVMKMLEEGPPPQQGPNKP
jgi:ABC-type glycerol-3-phosphate transport system substrate-binding protein